ncbi:hypothetical protein [Nonomuraea sp. NPDC049480]|uniref:hypothetical protein n=1 Tax=Nonomuraea sp. NPDC049480 TaxID=3364353 RepID=UPI003793DB52
MNLSLPTIRRRVIAIACALTMSVPVLQVTAASPANADGCDGGVVCSAITNLSVFRVRVYQDWCEGSGPCAGTAQMWLSPGASTPLLEDWDAFRIDAGWCYSYAIAPPGLPVRQYGERWIRVRNGMRANILGQARVPSFLCV